VKCSFPHQIWVSCPWIWWCPGGWWPGNEKEIPGGLWGRHHSYHVTSRGTPKYHYGAPGWNKLLNLIKTRNINIFPI